MIAKNVPSKRYVRRGLVVRDREKERRGVTGRGAVFLILVDRDDAPLVSPTLKERVTIG